MKTEEKLNPEDTKEIVDTVEEKRERKKWMILITGLTVLALFIVGACIWRYSAAKQTLAKLTQEESVGNKEADSSQIGESDAVDLLGETQQIEQTQATEIEVEENEVQGSEAQETEVQEMDVVEPVNWKDSHVKVKGIYVTGPKAGSAGMEDLIALVDETELNTMVIDVKDDAGNITFSMDLDKVQETNACVRYIKDMEGLLATLKEHEIYTIARIVCFKDDTLAKAKPELALKTASGTYVTDANGIYWVNPYKEEVWEYLTAIAQKALDMGFDEVQFDYVRFPVGNVANAAEYGVDMEANPKETAIQGFLSYVKEHLEGKTAVVGADLFGTVIGSEIDKNRVGQDYKALGETVDVLCPMIYPSHYANGVFGLSVPDAYPYETILAALTGSVEELQEIPEEGKAVVRPWLQSFTASWVDGHISYKKEQIEAQIKAVYDAGYEEWILWNASNRYSADGLLPKEEQ